MMEFISWDDFPFPTVSGKIKFNDDIPNCFWKNIQFMYKKPPSREKLEDSQLSMS
jgi:hypothetical protein